MRKRHASWPEALAAALERARLRPFKWGENDCCLFACNCVLAVTSTDIAVSFRGYKTRRQAVDLLKSHGGVAGIAEAVALEYGVPEIPVAQAGRGDICLFQGGYGDTLGVCAGDRVFAPGPEGLVAIPLSHAQRAWKIG